MEKELANEVRYNYNDALIYWPNAEGLRKNKKPKLAVENYDL